MDIEIVSDSQLVDHLNKCRCCFNVFGNEIETFKITKIIEKQFRELTQIELKPSICYSNKICELCKNELNNFINVKRSFVSKQQKLYDFFGEHPVKKEDGFVECDLDDELEPMVEVKIESFENESEEELIMKDRFHSYALMDDGIFDIPERIEDQIIDNTDNLSDRRMTRKMDRNCPHCLKSFHHLSLRKHIEEIHLDTKWYSCKKCFYETVTESCLVEHMQKHEARRKRLRERKICQQCGSSVLDLPRHIRKVHSKIHNHYCDICGLGTLFKSSLDSHMKTHMKKEKREFNCHLCEKQFDKRHILNRHIRLKHSEKERTHPCTICNKSFFTNSDLKKHFESHQGKVMPCEFCGKLFSCMNNLRTHLVYHQEPKFSCSFEGCNKKFFARKLLRAHTKVHEGQKDFACEYCDKKYYFSSHVKRHIRNFHMHLKIDCEISGCSSTFARKETYRNHVLSHHKDLTTDLVEDLLQRIRVMRAEDYIVCPP